ncbi:MAG: hypothetical protein NTU61_06055 [Candidatus Altiarchaeota archaeon]|nr:hypothetical protein [Candidatus Altiarchaeota archaeon]
MDYIIQVSKHGQATLTIPKLIVDAKGWTQGTKLNFRFGSKGELILEEKKE